MSTWFLDSKLSTCSFLYDTCHQYINGHGFINKACPEHLFAKEDEGDAVLAIQFVVTVILAIVHYK